MPAVSGRDGGWGESAEQSAESGLPGRVLRPGRGGQYPLRVDRSGPGSGAAAAGIAGLELVFTLVYWRGRLKIKHWPFSISKGEGRRGQYPFGRCKGDAPAEGWGGRAVWLTIPAVSVEGLAGSLYWRGAVR